MENVLCLRHVFVAGRHMDSCNVFKFLKKKLDIQMILQLSECLSATNICEQKFPMCDFMFMQHNSHSDKVSLQIQRLVSPYIYRLPGVTGRNFPPVSFFPGEKPGRPILSPGKKLTSQFFPHPVSFFPPYIFFIICNS